MCVIDFVFAVYSLGFRAIWLGLGVLGAPVGFYGAARYHRLVIIGYLCYLFVDMVLQFVAAFLSPDGVIIALSLLVWGLQLFMVYYVYQFLKRLPAPGTLLIFDLVHFCRHYDAPGAVAQS